MGDHAQFDQSAYQILRFMAGEESAGVRDLLVTISSFDPDRKMPSVSALAKAQVVPVEDWNSLWSLVGCGYAREVLWEPKREPEEEVVSEIVKAARNHDFESVWKLVEAGADLIFEDKDGEILECLVNNRVREQENADERGRWLQSFLRANAKVNARTLKTAAMCSPLSEFAQLLKANGDPNAGSEWNQPVIVDAGFSSIDPMEKVKLLIEAGADPNRRNVVTSSSGSVSTFGILDRCVACDLFEMAEYVVQQGFDPTFVERAYWEVRANKKEVIKDRWLKILESYLPSR